MEPGQLEMRPWQDEYLRRERFDQDAMLTLIEEVLQSGAAAGYRLTRFLAHMEWALLDKPGVDDLVDMRRASTTYFPSTAIRWSVPTDLSKFGSSVAMDIMRTHPVVIIGGLLQENPFFVSPDQFLLEIGDGSDGRFARAQGGRITWP